MNKMSYIIYYSETIFDCEQALYVLIILSFYFEPSNALKFLEDS